MLKYIILFVGITIFLFFMTPVFLCRVFCKTVTFKDIKRMFTICYGKVDIKKLKNLFKN